MLAVFEEVIFYLLFFSIPFQRRVIFWQQNWYFNEWQSASFYFTDFLMIGMFLCFLLSRRKNILNIKNLFRIKSYSLPDIFLILFLLVALVSLKNAYSIELGILDWLKLLEFVALYFYIRYIAVWKFKLDYALGALFTGGLFQATIAIAQFVKQSNVGLGVLGEGVISSNIIGIAIFMTESGEKLIRAYGTTPHPNILAGYLLLSLFGSFILYKRKNYLVEKYQNYFLSGFGIIVFGLLVTFSRTAIAVFGVWILAALFAVKPMPKKILIVTFISIALFIGLYHDAVKSRITINSKDEAVALRVYYNKESLKSGVNLFGVGWGNFVNWFMFNDPFHPRWFYQPVHNIYLLIYSETGLAGIGSFVLFLLFLLKNSWNSKAAILVGSMLFIGLFDHYPITLQQGMFFLWVPVSLMEIDPRQYLYN